MTDLAAKLKKYGLVAYQESEGEYALDIISKKIHYNFEFVQHNDNFIEVSMSCNHSYFVWPRELKTDSDWLAVAAFLRFLKGE